MTTRLEPVAWRVKDYADGWILFHHEAPARKSGEARNGALVQPLYAAAPAHEGMRDAVAGAIHRAMCDGQGDQDVIKLATDAILAIIAKGEGHD